MAIGLVVVALAWLAYETSDIDLATDPTSAHPERTATGVVIPDVPLESPAAVVSDVDRPAGIRIRVVDAFDDSPLAGATIRVEPRHTSLSVVGASEDGIVALTDAHTGSTITVEHEGYCPATVDWRTISATSVQPIHVRLRRHGDVRVTTQRWTGEVVQGVSVHPQPTSDSTEYASCWPAYDERGTRGSAFPRTDLEGTTLLRDLPTGVPIDIVASGSVLDSRTRISIDPGTRHADVVLTVIVGAVVVGSVVDSSGNGIAGIGVELQPQAVSGSRRLLSRTNTNGAYRFSAVPEGPASIAVATDARHAVVVRVAAPETSVQSFVLSESTLLEGRLESAYPFSASCRYDVEVYAQGEFVCTTTTDASGGFKARVPHGVIHLTVRTIASPQSSVVAESSAIAPGPPVTIELDEHEAVLSLELPAGVQPRSVIAFPTSQTTSPVPPALVFGNSVGPFRVEAEAGRLTVPHLLPAWYDVLIESAEHGNAWLRSIELPPGKRVDLAPAPFGWGSVIAEVQSGENERAQSNDAVVVSAYGGRRYAISEAGDAGAARVPAGPYVIAEERDPIGRDDAQYLDVYPGRSVSVVVPTIDFGGIIGSVEDRGLGIGAVTVRLAALNAPFVQSSGSPVVVTDVGGGFSFSDIPVGAYIVSAENAEHNRSVSIPVTVVPKLTTNCRIELASAQCEMVLMDRGERVLDVQAVNLVRATGERTRHSADPVTGTVSVCEAQGPVLLIAERAGYYESRKYRGNALACALLPAVVSCRSEGATQVELATAELAIDFADGPSMLAPSAVLTSVDGVSLVVYRSAVPLHIRREGSKGFIGVPLGAEVTLLGRSATGQMTKTVKCVGARTEVTWP